MDSSNDRAAQRKARLQQIEIEQLMEDAEALKMTEDQRQALLESFVSVKVEFCDLDGLQWSKSALIKHDSSTLTRKISSPVVVKPTASGAFAVLTNADLATFTEEQTVRASVSPVKAVYATDDFDLPPAKHRRRSCSRSRSPVKGLFPQFDDEAELSTPYHTANTPASAPASISVFSEPITPIPVYMGGSPIERATSRKKRTLSRTYTKAEITFGVSSDVVSEVMRGRATTRRSDVDETDTAELGVVRKGPPVAAPPRPPSRLGGPRFSNFQSRNVFVSSVEDPDTPVPIMSGDDDNEEADEEGDPLMTPTPARYTSSVDFPVSPSPVLVPSPAKLAPPRGPRSRAPSGPLKRKRTSGPNSRAEPFDPPPASNSSSTLSQ